jgi:Aspartyl/Asparaginyl beta-hydroxylase
MAVTAGTDRKRSFSRTQKLLIRRVLFPLAVFVPFGYFLPKIALFYVVCGLYDVGRNRPLSFDTMRRYFLGNGFLTWVLSPINVLLDLLSLPHVNKGIYRPEDLPADYQAEIKRLIDTAERENLVAKLEERSKENARTMIFFKWYGVNVDTFLDIPAFHEDWKYVQTIGVSVFNKKVSTSKHFGYLRGSLRLLYNLNDMSDHSAYIVVGDTTSYWKENKLFIFDDTLLHQSFNETDQTRYCLFVDFIRPSPFPGLMRGVVTLVRLISRSFNHVFYQNWKVIGR